MKRLLFLFLLSLYLNHSTKAISSLIRKTLRTEEKIQIFDKIERKTSPGQGYEVHIVNKLPINSTFPLNIHCASKDDDLGNHTLNLNDDFNWHFKMNYGLSTMFFCRFKWGSKDQAHEVFNKHIAFYCEGYNEKADGNICLWSIKEDGFWISNEIPPRLWTQIYQ
ncbi:hypothetical protein MIMGU_mgv1a026865mg, partial [Erythranthe guttata]